MGMVMDMVDWWMEVMVPGGDVVKENEMRWRSRRDDGPSRLREISVQMDSEVEMMMKQGGC